MTRIVLRIVFGAICLSLIIWPPLHAQTTAISDIKGKVFDAKLAQQTFAGGLRHCSELNGTNFYLQPRDRVLNLEDFHRSLDNLALQGVFNPATKRPWNQQDADARWQEVKQQAASDQAKCALVASLPYLQKKLDELQQQAAASQTDTSKDNK